MGTCSERFLYHNHQSRSTIPQAVRPRFRIVSTLNTTRSPFIGQFPSRRLHFSPPCLPSHSMSVSQPTYLPSGIIC